jgi:hypothetical protein
MQTMTYTATLFRQARTMLGLRPVEIARMAAIYLGQLIGLLKGGCGLGGAIVGLLRAF